MASSGRSGSEATLGFWHTKTLNRGWRGWCHRGVVSPPGHIFDCDNSSGLFTFGRAFNPGIRIGVFKIARSAPVRVEGLGGTSFDILSDNERTEPKQCQRPTGRLWHDGKLEVGAYVGCRERGGGIYWKVEWRFQQITSLKDCQVRRHFRQRGQWMIELVVVVIRCPDEVSLARRQHDGIEQADEAILAEQWCRRPCRNNRRGQQRARTAP